MKIDVWSDIACPFCYLGKVTLESALSKFEHADDVEVVYHSFLLNPGLPVDYDGDLYDYLTRKLGVSREQAIAMNTQLTSRAAEQGLQWHMDQVVVTNLIDAHRLTHFAATQGKRSELITRFFEAYFSEGLHLGQREVLADLASSIGLDRAKVLQVLESEQFIEPVQADIERAQQLGITGVPFFVFNDKYGVSGAQPEAVFTQVLNQAWQESQSLTVVAGAATGSAATGTGADACTDDSCAT